MAEFILHTSRLALREMTWDDLDFLATMLADPRVMQHYAKCCTRDEAHAWLGRVLERYQKHGHAFWLVSLRATGEPIGQVGLLLQHVDGVDEPEIGYMIHALYWRQGYALEAAAGVRDYAIGKLGKQRLVSMIRPANIPSQRVALRVGMKPERLTIWHDREHLMYSMACGAALGTAGSAP